MGTGPIKAGGTFYGGRPHKRCARMLAGTSALAAAVAAFAQPSVLPRERVTPSGGGYLFEPSIAAGPDLVVAVWRSVGEDVRYAYRETGSGQWVDGGVIESPLNPTMGDPSVTYDARDNTFVAAARSGQIGGPDDDSYLLTSHFVMSSRQFEQWVIRGESHISNWGFDKPWIVSGDSWLFPGGQELYITCTDDTGAYAALFRSLDGGENWSYTRIYLFDDPNQPVHVPGTLQPAVWHEGDLYLAYIKGVSETESVTDEYDLPTQTHGEIRILRGIDGDAQAVYWEPLRGLSGQPLALTTYTTDVGGKTPGDLKGVVIPYLVADPTNPDRLYLLYHDLAYAGSADVNVYCRRLDRNPLTGRWTANPRVKVNNDDDPTGQFDQFTPVAAVDGNGRVHVIFYDDRRFEEQEDGQTYPPPKFDMYYAYSETSAVSWTNARMPGPVENPDEAALDWGLSYGLDPREYNGITWFGNRIWNAYAGTWASTPNKAFISWNPIDWP